MALIQCPECLKEVSDEATNCPHCDCSMPEREATDNSRGVTDPFTGASFTKEELRPRISQEPRDNWISFLNIVAWLAFAGLLIVTVVLTIAYGKDNSLIGFVVFLGGILASFVALALIKVMLYLLIDVSIIAKHYKGMND